MKNIEKGIYHRSELLLGADVLQLMAEKKVIIFGIGGVGSWCAESLVRTGIRNITLVDSDIICVSNVNRQIHATTKTVGEVKVEVLKTRLLEINPNANVQIIQNIYNAETHDFFQMEQYDFIIDAIDTLSSKMHLIRKATQTNAVFISSMGAALKIDPTRIQVAEFWKVRGCPLASAIRKRIKKGELPAKKFMCVYSDELLENRGVNAILNMAEVFGSEEEQLASAPEQDVQQSASMKVAINGSLSHITAIFGFTIAGLVVQSIYAEVGN